MQSYDVVIATDFRFHGGSSESTLEEIHTQHEAGLRTGIYHLRAPIIRSAKPLHPGFVRALLDGECDLLNFAGPAEAKLLLFRQPSVVDHFDGPLPRVKAQTVGMVVNAPPLNALGRVFYILPFVQARLKAVYGTEPRIFPIGPVLRDAITTYYDGSAHLDTMDWGNIFDLERFAVEREAPRNPIRIGRHSRAGPEKWPDTPEHILQAYPERDDIDVRILGGAEPAEILLGRRPRTWTVYAFGAREPEDFLRDIDVFVYYHHPNWIEAFGRVILEALASGLPAILPPHFEPLVGEAALYGPPSDVPALIDRLRDPQEYRVRSKKALERAAAFTRAMHTGRLAGLGVHSPTPGAQPASRGQKIRGRGWRSPEDFWRASFVVGELSAPLHAVLERMQRWLWLILGEPAPTLYVAPEAVLSRELRNFRVERSATAGSDAAAGLTLRVSRTPIGFHLAITIPDMDSLQGKLTALQRAILQRYSEAATAPPGTVAALLRRTSKLS